MSDEVRATVDCQYRAIARNERPGHWRPQPCREPGVVSYLGLRLCVEHAGKAREIRRRLGVDAAMRFLGALPRRQGAPACPGGNPDGHDSD